jgi:Cobalamin biosynthesis protein CobN and related Mg-chelatases
LAHSETGGFLHPWPAADCQGPSGGRLGGDPNVLPTAGISIRWICATADESRLDLGRRSAEQLLELYLLEEGEPLRHLALSVWGTATMRNGGEDIAQMLALMGVRPVWDGPTRRLVDLEVIPLALLQRPRVDVTLRISGLFRDAFPQLVRWVDRALALVAGLEEDAHANPLAARSRERGRPPRVFGSAPGAYGAGLQALIDSGQWEEQGDLADAFLSWSRWAYDGQGEPQEDREGLERS